MAHVRQELALRAAGLLGVAPGLQQFADVVVERHRADALAADDHRDARDLHVDQRSVLVPPLAQSDGLSPGHGFFR